MNYGTILTDRGRAALAAAIVNGTDLSFSEISTRAQEGDLPGAPSPDQTALNNEVWRAPINNITQDQDNTPWVKLECVIPADQGGFWIREIGIFTDDGILFAIMKYPETYKPNLADGLASEFII
ncbi:MAG: phage tail protein, partial [Alphaproteobacteria bacterium]